MIFVASQADASALNLGKISIKTINDVSQETYDVIAAYGNKSFTDDQIIAIDDFLIAFNNASWKSKVKRLIIPLLSNDNNNPTVSTNGVSYENLYDIVTKEAGKLASGAGTNGDTGSPAITFKGGIFVNAVVNNANTTPFLKYSEIAFNVRDFMFGVYGNRGTDENNISKHIIFSIREPNYSCSFTTKSIQVGASNKVSVISTKETNKGDDFGILLSYNYSSSFFKGYKDSMLVSTSTVTDTYANGTINDSFGFGTGSNLTKNIGDKIRIITLGSSMNEEEMQEYDKLLQTLLSCF